MTDMQSAFEVNDSVIRKRPTKLSQNSSGRWPLGETSFSSVDAAALLARATQFAFSLKNSKIN